MYHYSIQTIEISYRTRFALRPVCFDARYETPFFDVPTICFDRADYRYTVPTIDILGRLSIYRAGIDLVICLVGVTWVSTTVRYPPLKHRSRQNGGTGGEWGGGVYWRHASCMAVVVCPYTFASLRCRDDGVRRAFIDQAGIVCTKHPLEGGLWG